MDDDDAEKRIGWIIQSRATTSKSMRILKKLWMMQMFIYEHV
jgi:hypothetical protein